MIEIEKKFLLTDAQRERLLDGAEVLGNKKVEDIYMDTDDYRLTTHDFWLRRRDGEYELKAPLKSSGESAAVTNRYHELTDLREIARELQLTEANDFEAALAQQGTRPFITCFTDRTSYEKAGFHIDVDMASYDGSDLTYALTEIELLVASEAEAEVAEQKIIAFAKSIDLTIDQPILGKVAEYLRVEKPQHYDALVAAGVLAG